MKKYRATKLTKITGGRVRMGKPQAFRRAGHLTPVPGKPDEYEIRNFIILAPGEMVMIDTEDPESLGLTPVNKPTTKKETLKKPATKKAAKKK